MNQAVLIAGLTALAAMAAGCGAGRDTAVHVRIRFADVDPAHALQSVTVISGSDKFAWPRLSGGEVRTVTLHPGDRDDRQLALLFRLNDIPHTWDGPKVDAGVGYCIDMVVDAAGRTSHRHGLMPCKEIVQ